MRQGEGSRASRQAPFLAVSRMARDPVRFVGKMKGDLGIRAALGALARIDEPVFGPCATTQGGARCRNAPGVFGIRLHCGSRHSGSGHIIFDGEQGHQGGKMKTVMTIPDAFFFCKGLEVDAKV